MISPRQFQKKAGFTLIEVLLATLLLALTVFAVVQSKSSALFNTAESENIAIAVQLLQKKTSEMEFYFQKKINIGGISSAFEKREGTFEEPFQDYKWRAEFRETKLAIKKTDLVTLMTQAGMESGAAEVQVDQQSIVIGNVNNTIKNNFGELEVWIDWNRFNRNKTINIVTHLIPNRPKISLSMNPETP